MTDLESRDREMLMSDLSVNDEYFEEPVDDEIANGSTTTPESILEPSVFDNNLSEGVIAD